MRNYIARKIGYPTQDIVKKTNILKTLPFLKESQYWSEEKLKVYQMTKIQKLVYYVYNNIPYYQKLFRKEGIHPNDINSIKQFKKIPVLTKEIARAENMNLIPKFSNLKNIRKTKTGGTSGPPLIIYRDAATRSFTWSAFYRWYDWIGIDLGDRITTLWGTPTVLSMPISTKIKKRMINFLQNTSTINSFAMNQNTLPKIIEEIKIKKPKLLKGYLSAILQLAEYCSEKRIDLSIQAISSTTETLLPHVREYLENQFECKVYDQYGGGECESIAFECKEQSGLHITNEHVYLEILNADGHDEDQNTGDIIVTDLDNYAMPLIRYEIGDNASFASKKYSCDCGVRLPKLKSIIGRATDTIILKNGSKVHGVFFTDILSELNLKDTGLIRRFQVSQEKYGEIEFRIETSEDLKSSSLSLLENALNRFFFKVEIKIFQKLEHDKSGKFRYVISKIK